VECSENAKMNRKAAEVAALNEDRDRLQQEHEERQRALEAERERERQESVKSTRS